MSHRKRASKRRRKKKKANRLLKKKRKRVPQAGDPRGPAAPHPAPDEEQIVGPFRLSRFGSNVMVENLLSDKEMKEVRRRMKEARPTTKATVDRTIETLLTIFSTHDPLDIIVPLMVLYHFALDPTSSPDGQPKNHAHIEYLHSIATALPRRLPQKETEPAVVQNVLDLLKKMENDVWAYYFFELAEDKYTPEEMELRSIVLNHTLRVRGEGYRMVMKQTAVEMFEKTDDFLTNILGITAADLYTLIESLVSQVIAGVQSETAARSQVFKALTAVVPRDAARKRPIELGTDTDEVWDLAEEHIPNGVDTWEKLGKWLYNIGSRDLVKLEVDESQAQIIRHFAMEYGENESFVKTPPEYRGWPLNSSRIFEKPFVLHDGSFFMPDPVSTLRSFRPMVEGVIRERDPQYFARRFLPQRDAYLEKKVAQLLAKVFGSESVKVGLRYKVLEQGQTKDCELDCAVIFGGTVLLVESKAASLSSPARRGGIERLKRDIGRLVSDAHGQALRARDYILGNAVARFYDETGNVIVEINRDDVNRIILVSTTLDHLGPAASYLSAASRAGMVDEEPDLWCVSVLDLAVVVDILQRPAVFLHYLTRRIPLNKPGTVFSVDELDLMMYYIQKGLYFDAGSLQGLHKLSIDTHTDDLDRYYYSLDPLTSNGCSRKKPTTRLPSGLELLLTALEKRPAPPAMECAIRILNSDEETRNKIAENVRRIDSKAAGDGPKFVGLRFPSDQGNYAILLARQETKPGPKLVRDWTTKWFEQRETARCYVVVWVGPIAEGDIYAWIVDK